MSNKENKKLDFQDEYKLRIERVIRWDQYRISQFSYVNNLIITLNLGFLGFFITQSGLKFSCDCALRTLQIMTLLFLLTSFLVGILAVLNRLKDFRSTARLTKVRKKIFENTNGTKMYADIDDLKSEMKTLDTNTRKNGPKTWFLLRLEIWSFFIGTVLGILFLVIYKNASG